MPTETGVEKLKPVSKSETIKHREVYVDTSILTPGYSHLANLVSYGVFTDKGDPAIVPEKIEEVFKTNTHSGVCFSGLLYLIKANKANRMFYKMQTVLPGIDKVDYPPILTSKERSQWLNLAKDYKLLPEYINEDSMEDEKPPSELAKGVFIIDLEGLTPSLLYIYLSTIRNIREDPGLPKAVLYLVNEIGMNFYLAYVFASAIVMSTSGHHIIQSQRPYGVFKQKYSNRFGYVYEPIDSSQLQKDVKIPVSTSIGIQRMLHAPNKYDKKSVMTCAGTFLCNRIITGISRIQYKATLPELLDDHIVAAAMSKTDKEADKYINKYINEKARSASKEVGK